MNAQFHQPLAAGNYRAGAERQRLNRDKRFNNFCLIATIICGIFAAGLLKDGMMGHTSKSGHYFPANPMLLPWGKSLGILAAVFAIATVCMRNYFIIDFDKKSLVYRYSFLWLKKDSVRLAHKEILVITTQGKKRSSKYNTWWVYRVAALGSDGKFRAMSDWRREACGECNMEAAEIAQRFGCNFSQAELASSIRIIWQGSLPILSFHPAGTDWGKVIILVFIILVAVIAMLTATLRSR